MHRFVQVWESLCDMFESAVWDSLAVLLYVVWFGQCVGFLCFSDIQVLLNERGDSSKITSYRSQDHLGHRHPVGAVCSPLERLFRVGAPIQLQDCQLPYTPFWIPPWNHPLPKGTASIVPLAGGQPSVTAGYKG